MFDLVKWAKRREQPGTLASSARRVLDLGSTFAEAMRAFEANYLAEALLRYDCSLRVAAREIGMSRPTIYRRLRLLGIDVQQMITTKATRGDSK